MYVGDGRNMCRRIRATTLALGVLMAACSGGDAKESPSPQPTLVTRPSPTPTIPSPIGTADVARWAKAVGDAMDPFLQDLQAAFDAVKARDLDALGTALRHIPDDVHEAIRRIDASGPAPPGLQDEVDHLRGLLHQTERLIPSLQADCLHSPGLPCAADVAQLADITAQIIDVLKPLGIDVNIRVEL